MSCTVKTSMGLHNNDDDATLLSFDEYVGCFHWRPARELLLWLLKSVAFCSSHWLLQSWIADRLLALTQPGDRQYLCQKHRTQT